MNPLNFLGFHICCGETRLFRFLPFFWSSPARKSLALLCLCCLLITTGVGAPLPANLALTASVSANSEYSAQYEARFAIDGKIPAAGSREDVGQAWCVRGDTHRNSSEFALSWPNAVNVAEIVYYSRTAWFAEEGWKDYEVVADGQPAPVARGTLQMGHGPQRIPLPEPVRTRNLQLRFLSSYGGPNPGAAEIQVFGTPLPAEHFARFRKLERGTPELVMEDNEIEDKDLAARVASGGLGFDRLLAVHRHELNPSHVYTYHVEGFRAGGALCTVSLKGAGPVRELVASPEGQILDCDLSWDGREVLFSWRRQQGVGYQVYRINVDGTGLQQLTDGPHHNYNACWLPDGGIAFLSTRSSRFAYCWISPVGILHRMERDGSRVVQLSANIVNDFTPSVLDDGRIIYSRWEYVDKPAIPIQSLWTIRPDGTGLAGFYGNRVLSPATFMEARSIPGSGQILCLLTSHNGPCRGAIGMVDIAHGNNAPQAIRNLTPEVGIGQVDKGDGNHIRGPYENPFPIDQQFYLVSKRGSPQVRSYEGSQIATLLRPKGGMGFYNPRPVRRRPAPPVLAQQASSARYDASASIPFSGPAEPGEPPVQWASVVLQDVYRGLAPWVKPGEVKEICVVEEMRKVVRTDVNNRAFGFQFPVISCGATYAAKRVWGYAPVAADGSACFNVPANRPIYFMALDAHGRALQRMRTFTHLMPGETQGCVGCHEPRQQSVAGRQPLHRAPDALRPPEWGEAVGFDYARVVQPVLDDHCVKCHSGALPAGKVDLCSDATDFFNVSYEVLARGRQRSGEAEWDSPYVNWIPTYNGMEQNILEVTPRAWGSPRSKLADLLISGHGDTNGVPRVNLKPAELRRVLAWIDLNVPYYGTSETTHPETRGCRQLYPAELDKTLAEVSRRRCAECHREVPRPFWTRITNPHLNAFLLAPLPKEAGGSGVCGKAVFQTTSDPDYVALLRTFEPILSNLQQRPRTDMAGAKPADVDRSCLGSLY
jgi:hypothetical protein